MPVPNTSTFSLQDVKDHLGLGATTSLTACFTTANALPEYWWDDTYKGTKNSLYDFRNYGYNTNISIGNFGTQYDNMTTYDYNYKDDGTLLGGGPAVTYNVWKSFGVDDTDAVQSEWTPVSGYEILGGVVGTLSTACIVKVGTYTIDFSPCTITGSYSGSTYRIRIENLQADTLTYPPEQHVADYVMTPLNSSGQILVATVADETPPTPGTLTWNVGVYWNSTTAALSWTPGSDNLGVTTIKVQQNYNGGAFSTIYTYTGAPPSTSSVNHTISRTNGGGYAYRIAYYDDENNESFSNQRGSIYDIGVPTTVTGLANYGAPTTTSIYLIWTAATDSISGIAGYNIYSSTFSLLDTTSGTGVNWTNSGLTAGSTHAYYVKARDNAGNLSSSYSNLETTYTLTLAPTLSAGTTTGTSIVVSRNSVSGAASYTLYWRVSGGSWAVATTSMGTSYTKTSLSSDTEYQFYAKAANLDGYFSANSSTLTHSTLDTTLPTAPGTPTFSNTTTSGYTVSWTASTDTSGILRYEVSRDLGTAFSVGNSLSYAASDGAGDTDSWRVRAVDNAGNTGPYSGTASWATKTIAPTLTFSSDTSTTQTLTRNSVTGGSSYRLYWKVSGGSYALATSSMGTSYTKTGLLPLTSYSYYVVSRNAYGQDSAASNIITNTTDGLLTPTGLFEVTDSNTSITLGWDTVEGATGYTILRDGSVQTTSTGTTKEVTGLACDTSYGFQVKATSAQDDSSYSGVVNMSTNIETVSTPTSLAETSDTETSISMSWGASTSGCGGTITAYYVSIDGGGDINTGSNLTYTASGLTVGTSYGFRVRALSSYGIYSSYTSTVNMSTDAGDITAPSTVTGLVQTAAADNSVSIDWTDATDNVGVVGYQIYNSSFVPSWTSTTSNKFIPSLAGGSTSILYIKAYDAAGNYSTNYSSGLTYYVAPIQPTISLSSKTDSVITITWTSPTGADGYDCEYKATSSGTWINSGDNTSPAAFSGLSASTSYDFRVRAHNNNWYGSYSSTFTTSTTAYVDSTPPTTPGTPSISGIQTSSTAVLTWTASTDNVGVTGYQVYRNGSLHKTTATNSVTVDAVSLGEEDTFKVRAYDAATNYSSFSGDYVVYFAPIAVTLTAGDVGVDWMDVNWTFAGTNNGVNELDAEIDYEFAAIATDVQQASDTQTTTTFSGIDVSAESGGDCSIRIRLNVGQVKGAWSNWATKTLLVSTTA